MAILVKGLSAVGCFTWICCHGGQAYQDKKSEVQLYEPAFVCTAGEINFQWAIDIINYYKLIFGDEGLPLIETNNNYIKFEILSARHAKHVWLNIMQMGVWIYLNRVEPRRIRGLKYTAN